MEGKNPFAFATLRTHVQLNQFENQRSVAYEVCPICTTIWQGLQTYIIKKLDIEQEVRYRASVSIWQVKNVCL